MDLNNSEHSGSMDSDEFSHLLGHNYGNNHVQEPVDNFALLIQDENSLNTNDVAHMEPLSPGTLERIREQNLLILNDVSIRHDHGPVVGASVSSQGSHKGGSSGEIISALKSGVVASITSPVQGNTLAAKHAGESSFQTLQDNFVVQQRVLILVNPNVEYGETIDKFVSNKKKCILE